MSNMVSTVLQQIRVEVVGTNGKPPSLCFTPASAVVHSKGALPNTKEVLKMFAEV
jgi:hypothetical protein